MYVRNSGTNSPGHSLHKLSKHEQLTDNFSFFFQLLVINFILVLTRVFCYNNLYLKFFSFLIIDLMKRISTKKEEKSYLHKGKNTTNVLQ